GKTSIALEGGTGETMAFGPGHVVDTPKAGEAGTAVYAAHRDTHFSYLGDLVAGDDIKIVRTDGVEVHFRVTGTSVVRWDQSGIDALEPGRHLVLATCWPLDSTVSGPLRYVVHAEAVSSREAS